MNWLWIAGGVVLVAILVLRRRSRTMPESGHSAAPVAANHRLGDLKAFEGSACIYEEGATVLKVRLLEVSGGKYGLVFALQVLRADGLSDVKEEQLNLETSWASLSHSSKLIHAHYTNWKLFLDSQLIQKVLDLAQGGADLKAIKRVLLEHQMK